MFTVLKGGASAMYAGAPYVMLGPAMVGGGDGGMGRVGMRGLGQFGIDEEGGGRVCDSEEIGTTLTRTLLGGA